MEQMQMNMPDIYDAALYLRLSKDDMEEGRCEVREQQHCKSERVTSELCKKPSQIFRSLIYMWMTDTQEEILTDLSLNE